MSQRKRFLFSLFVILIAGCANAEPCFGYTVNDKTNECVYGLLYADGGIPTEYSNCRLLDGCTNESIGSDPSDIDCRYVGCANNCQPNETKATAEYIGCVPKGESATGDNTSVIIGAAVILVVAAYLLYWKTKKRRDEDEQIS